MCAEFFRTKLVILGFVMSTAALPGLAFGEKLEQNKAIVIAHDSPLWKSPKIFTCKVNDKETYIIDEVQQDEPNRPKLSREIKIGKELTTETIGWEANFAFLNERPWVDAFVTYVWNKTTRTRGCTFDLSFSDSKNIPHHVYLQDCKVSFGDQATNSDASGERVTTETCLMTGNGNQN